MAFEGLTEKLSNAFKKLRGKGRLTEADVKEAMREVRMALLEADVSYKVVKDFVKDVTARCVGADVLEALSPAQQIIKIVNEELTRLMGSENAKLNIAPTSIARPPSNSSRSSAKSSASPCSRWGRRTRSTSQRPPSNTPASTAMTWSFSTRPAGCTSTRRSWTSSRTSRPP